MGEARRRKLARIDRNAQGLPVPRPDGCPACRSKRIAYTKIKNDCEYGACVDCEAIWESFPEMMVEDEVCAEPCDNCAFRPGSPEQADTEKWRELIASLDPKETEHGAWFSGRFYCHKGIPINKSEGPGNFLFPQMPFSDELAPGHTIPDVSKMRTCSGFLRMFWAKSAKMEKGGA